MNQNFLEEKDIIYSRYMSKTNMSYEELLDWSKNPCSKKASLDRSPIKRNLHLLKTVKLYWGNKEISWAKKTISFISRMKANNSGEKVSKDCPYSKKTISLMNWAYDPNK